VQAFLIEALRRLKQLVPFENIILKNSRILYLKTFEKEKWRLLAQKFPKVISTSAEKSKFVNELNVFETEYKGFVLQNRIEQGKSNLFNLWTGLKGDYPMMGELSLAMLVLPYSSCSVERLFSSINTFHAKKIIPLRIVEVLNLRKIFRFGKEHR